MSGFKGTPGPWNVGVNHCYFEINSENGGIGDVCMSGHAFDAGQRLGPTAEANAKLIAAAPELLEALQAVVRVADRATDEFDMARAAIAKALGQ